MSEHIKITLDFDKIPTATLQQKKARIVRGRTRDKDYVQFYEPSNVKEAISILHYKLSKYRIEAPLNGPIAIEIVWIFGTKTKKQWGKFRTERPDLDNMAKILLDRMTKLGFFGDDSQIAMATLVKLWGQKSQIRIHIHELTEDEGALI